MSKLEFQPILTGRNITLRPLGTDDFPGLFQAASDPAIWEQHPDSTRYKREVFRERFFSGAITSGGAVAVIDNRTGGIIGSSRYYDWDPGKRELAIGYTFLVREHWGTGTNREMKELMLAHAFKHAVLVWFHVGRANLRSRRAVEKLGATLSHEEERDLVGEPFVQLYYKLYASAWNLS